MKPLIEIINTDNETNLINEIMGHKQDMTPEQRLKWDTENHIKRIEARKGHNYEYWNRKHDEMLENGWDLFVLNNKSDTIQRHATPSEDYCIEIVNQLRKEGNFARIVCGYEINVQHIKMHSVIFKPKNGLKQICVQEWLYKGCFISRNEHPQLFGKYEVFKNNENQDHIGRVYTFKEAKQLCKENECFDNHKKF